MCFPCRPLVEWLKNNFNHLLSQQPPVSCSEQNPDFMSVGQPTTDQPFKTGLEVKSDSQVSRARLHSAAFFKTPHPFETENYRDEKLTFPFKIPSSILLLKH